MTANNATSSGPGRFTGWHFLAICLASFGIVFAVNGYFIFKAVATFDGLEVNDAYQKGRAYNQVIEAMEVQKARGWKSSLDVKPGSAPQGTQLVLTLADRAGAPLNGLKVRATFWRPVVAGADQTKPLAETAPGRYEAQFLLPYDGVWAIRVAALDDKGETFVEEKRVFIKAR